MDPSKPGSLAEWVSAAERVIANYHGSDSEDASYLPGDKVTQEIFSGNPNEPLEAMI